MGPDLTSQRGQSVVEGLLVLVVLIGMILGVLDFGQMMFLHQTLTERARAAARYAALNPADVDGARQPEHQRRRNGRDDLRLPVPGLLTVDCRLRPGPVDHRVRAGRSSAVA